MEQDVDVLQVELQAGVLPSAVDVVEAEEAARAADLLLLVVRRRLQPPSKIRRTRTMVKQSMESETDRQYRCVN